MSGSFNDAQQAANVAYQMTIDATGNIEQAAASYKQVMAAYMAQAYPTQPRQYIDSDRDVTPLSDLADKIAKSCDDWTCNFCGIAQPAWAGDCLTCETVPMMGDRQDV